MQRKIWGDHIGAPKTEAREAGVYVVPVLRKILAKYKEGFPAGTDDWMFRGEKFLRPLDLDNSHGGRFPSLSTVRGLAGTHFAADSAPG